MLGRFHLRALRPLARSFASLEKDYYAVLGVSEKANDQEIKEAYRAKAKQFHPDASLLGDHRTPDINRFRDVAEAYAVLSIRENRLNYDLSRKDSTEILYESAAESAQSMVEKREERDVTGQPKYEYKRGSYVEFRKRQLRQERAMFNVDEFGRFRGGGRTTGSDSAEERELPGSWQERRPHHELPGPGTTEFHPLRAFGLNTSDHRRSNRARQGQCWG